jgi:hypothetical protein
MHVASSLFFRGAATPHTAIVGGCAADRPAHVTEKKR